MKTMKRAITLILALVIVLTLVSACGKKPGGASESPEASSDYVYVPKFMKIEGGDKILSTGSFAAFFDGRIYFSASVSEGSVTEKYPTGEKDADGNPIMGEYTSTLSKTKLVSIKDDGTDLKVLEGYKPSEIAGLPDGWRQDCSIERMTMDREGNIYIIEQVSASQESPDPEVPIPADGGTPTEPASTTEPTATADPATAKESTETTEPTAEASPTSEGGKNEVDGEAVPEEKTPVGEEPEGEDTEPQNAWFLRKLDKNGAELKSVDLGAAMKGEAVDFFYISDMAVSAGGDVVIGIGGMSFLVFDNALTMKGKPKLDGEKSLTRLFTAGDGKIFAIIRSGESDKLVNIDTAAATLGSEAELSVPVMEIFPGNADYNIFYNSGSVLKGYKLATGQAETVLSWINSDVDNNTLTFVLPLADGRIACFSSAMGGFAEMTDASPNAKASPELIVLSKVLRSELPAKTTLSYATAIGASELVGDKSGISMEDAKAALAKLDEGAGLFELGMTRGQYLQTLCNIGLGRFVDWQTGKCSFDSPDFIKMLEFANLFPETFDWESSGALEEDESLMRLVNGKQLLMVTTVSGDMMEFRKAYKMMNGKLSFTGLPGAAGNGSALMFGPGLAVTTACKDQAGAWSLISRFLTPEYQMKNQYGSLPVTQKAFDEVMKKNMTPTYGPDPNEEGKQIEVPAMVTSVGYKTPIEVKIFAMTKEEADMIMKLLDETKSSYTNDEKLTGIIMEEAALYFAGSKTAADTAKMIQNRVSIYVSEQS